MLAAVKGSRRPLTEREIAEKTYLALWGVQEHLRSLAGDKLVTKIGDKWYQGPPEDDRTIKGTIPLGDRQTPRQRVETLLRDKPQTFSQIVSELAPYRIDRFEVRSVLDRIGQEGYLSFGKKGYQLRKVRGQAMLPMGGAYA